MRALRLPAEAPARRHHLSPRASLARVDRAGKPIESSDPHECMRWHAMLAYIAVSAATSPAGRPHKFREKFGNWPPRATHTRPNHRQKSYRGSASTQYRLRQSPAESDYSMTIDAQALTQAANKLREALERARLAYLFSPGSYTMSAFQSCLAAAEAFDQHITELAYANSTEWLRKFPKIADAELSNVE